MASGKRSCFQISRQKFNVPFLLIFVINKQTASLICALAKYVSIDRFCSRLFYRICVNLFYESPNYHTLTLTC